MGSCVFYPYKSIKWILLLLLRGLFYTLFRFRYVFLFITMFYLCCNTPLIWLFLYRWYIYIPLEYIFWLCGRLLNISDFLLREFNYNIPLTEIYNSKACNYCWLDYKASRIWAQGTKFQFYMNWNHFYFRKPLIEWYNTHEQTHIHAYFRRSAFYYLLPSHRHNHIRLPISFSSCLWLAKVKYIEKTCFFTYDNISGWF